MVGIVYSFGYIALIRNQGEFDRDGFAELTAYQEYPLLNLESQCRDAGFGPYQFNFFYPFQRLVPYKLMHLVDLTQLDPPVRVEPSAPAGFYEDIQWSLGPLGVIGFSFVTGMLGTYFYSRALDSPPHLLIYCQMAYNLFVSHSFNEFLILAYFPGVLTFFIICAPLHVIRNPARAAMTGPLLILRRIV
jgi:oligosaccharide repeat unit polymerase